MEKIAILGGGIAGLTAAFELTATPELRERFDVTVYQMGWRLGGKGASGRNAGARQRIEEHGVHVWFGFYDNAFDVMRTCYEDMHRPEGAPLRTLDDAFKPCNALVLCDVWNRDWVKFQLDTPPNPFAPGGDHELPTFWEMVAVALHWCEEHWEQLREHLKADHRQGSFLHRVLQWLRDLGHDVEELAGKGVLHCAQLLVEHAIADLDTDAEHELLKLLAGMLGEFRDLIWHHDIRDHLDDDDLRIFFTTFDLITSVIVGIYADDLLDVGVHAVDDEEFTEWIIRHGAKAVTEGDRPQHRSPMLRAMYDVSFAFEGGDLQKPNMAAGTCIHVLMRLAFTYRGSLYYKMQAGMGDTVFAPLYLVLRDRGVHFEFFSDVQRLGLDADHHNVAEIEFARQVRTVGDAPYRPLRDVGGLPCWPNEPEWEQLVIPDQHRVMIRPSAEQFECSGRLAVGPNAVLHRGADFDRVVLAIPAAALTTICRELVNDRERNPKFAAMLENTTTVMTQALQLWVTKPICAHPREPNLGWTHSPDAIVGCFHEPLDTYCPMDQLLAREQWTPEDGVKGIAYFCGVLIDEPGENEPNSDHRVELRAIEVITRHLKWLWPGSMSDGEFDWNVLADFAHREGAARLEAQYVRSNIEPSERYTMTPAKSVGFRLSADQSGYDNMSLAGDWVNNGLNSGCIEAAVMAGMQAARHISGVPRKIVGEYFLAGKQAARQQSQTESRRAR